LARRLQEGEFDDLIRRTDVQLANRRTLPDWFYRPVWRCREAGPALPAQPGRTLLLLDELGLGQALAAELERLGDTCLLVPPGAALAGLPARGPHARTAGRTRPAPAGGTVRGPGGAGGGLSQGRPAGAASGESNLAGRAGPGIALPSRRYLPDRRRPGRHRPG